MTDRHPDKEFTGSIPEFYEAYLVPLIFEPYAADLAARVAAEPVTRVLEVAAGTGVLTRALADAVPPDAAIVATDINQPMLDHAASIRDEDRIEWRKADALDLPLAADGFDAVVCQFGVMFFPDRVRAYAEARRVLRPGGRLLFNTWDPIADNEFADVVTEALVPLFPDDPPRFLERTPHGYSDRAQIEVELRAAGFAAAPSFETVAARSEATDPSLPAVAYCQGTPLRNEIEQRDPEALARATAIATAALAARFGAGAVEGRIQGQVVSVRA